MLKKTIILILVTFFVFAGVKISFAERKSMSYYNRQTPFNDVTDYFATFGKSATEKKRIKHRRRAERKRYRLYKRDLKKKKDRYRKQKKRDKLQNKRNKELRRR